MPEPKVLHCAATGSDGRVYALGGTSNDGRPVTAAVFAYDVNLDAWTTVASMSAGPRRSFACASDAHGLVYAIGGYDFGNPPAALSRVEQYDPQLNSWTLLPDMPTPRQGAAAATGADGRMFVIGGTDTSLQTLDVTEIFDPDTYAWRTASPMTTPRTNFAAVAGLDGQIYVFGGYSGNASVATAEMYDPTSDIWTPFSSMNEARHTFAGVTALDGRIFAIGGGDDGTSVEAYDPSTGIWSQVSSMLVPRSGHAAALGPGGKMIVLGGDFLGTGEVLETVRTRSSVWAP